MLSLSKQLAKAYLAGELDEICVAFTNFVSVLTQTRAVLPSLPLSLYGLFPAPAVGGGCRCAEPRPPDGV
ncbi:MAG: hypothetical protein ACLU9S_08520 [Oscillospiraceae bacterium]